MTSGKNTQLPHRKIDGMFQFCLRETRHEAVKVRCRSKFTRLSKGHAIVFSWKVNFTSENRTKMGVMESLGVDGLLSDVQRMDKRQVGSNKSGLL